MNLISCRCWPNSNSCPNFLEWALSILSFRPSQTISFLSDVKGCETFSLKMEMLARHACVPEWQTVKLLLSTIYFHWRGGISYGFPMSRTHAYLVAGGLFNFFEDQKQSFNSAIAIYAVGKSCLLMDPVAGHKSIQFFVNNSSKHWSISVHPSLTTAENHEQRANETFIPWKKPRRASNFLSSLPQVQLSVDWRMEVLRES